MSIHQKIKDEVKEAMKAKDTLRLNVLRGLLTSFTNENVAQKRKPDEELSDNEALAVISRSVKQRKDSVEQFEKGGRPELAETEKAEMNVLEDYLPAQMSSEEVSAYVKEKLDNQNPKPSRSDSGRFIGIIMKELKGRADGSLVKEVVDRLLV